MQVSESKQKGNGRWEREGRERSAKSNCLLIRKNATAKPTSSSESSTQAGFPAADAAVPRSCPGGPGGRPLGGAGAGCGARLDARSGDSDARPGETPASGTVGGAYGERPTWTARDWGGERLGLDCRNGVEKLSAPGGARGPKSLRLGLSGGLLSAISG